MSVSPAQMGGVAIDELTSRVRSLDAERLRPERAMTLPDLLAELIASLHSLYLTQPDEHSDRSTTE